MRYGYTRISTVSQEGNTSLKGQEEEILERYPDAKIVSEVFSGAEKRLKFEEIIDKMQAGDMLICTKLDRFCRDTKEGLQYIDALLDKGCSIHILNMGLIEDSPMGRLIVTQLLAFAEFERALIVERCQTGKAKAKNQADFRDGRPLKYRKMQLDHAVSLLQHYSYSKVSDMTGISISTIQRHKNRLKLEANI